MSADDSRNATAPQTGAKGLDAGEGVHARTWAALQRLPGRFRKILLLREVEGLAMGEVARRLGLSRVAAERRWMRAIVLMAERLAASNRPRPSGSLLVADEERPVGQPVE